MSAVRQRVSRALRAFAERIGSRPLVATLLGTGALALRLGGVDRQSYWYDEDVALHFGRLGFLEGFAEQTGSLEGNTYPPGHAMLFHAWSLLAGDSPLSGRVFSALCSALAVALFFALLDRVAGRRAAWIGGLLLACAPMAVQYGQEMRAYALLQLLCIALLWAAERALSSGTLAAFAGLAALGAAAVYVHYYAALTVAGVLLHAALWREHRPPLRHWLVGGAVGVALLSPWLRASLQLAEVGAQWRASERPPWFAMNLGRIERTFAHLHGTYWRGVARAPAWNAARLALALFAVPAVAALARAARDAASGDAALRARARVVSLFALPLCGALVGPFALAALGLPYAYRYALPALAPWLALAAIGVSRLRPAWIAPAWTAAALALAAPGLLALHTQPHKEDWRAPLARLAAGWREGDCAVFTPFGGLPMSWQTYHRGAPHPPVEPLEHALDDARCVRVWLVSYTRLPAFAELARSARARADAVRPRLDAQQWHWTQLALYGPPRGVDAR